jgi:hypothetical protein
MKPFSFLRPVKYKTFHDLEFIPHEFQGIRSTIMFKNGYGASVVKTQFSYGGSDGLYELAILDNDGDICYDTPITQDVIGYLTEEEVTEILKQIQNL